MATYNHPTQGPVPFHQQPHPPHGGGYWTQEQRQRAAYVLTKMNMADIGNALQGKSLNFMSTKRRP